MIKRVMELSLKFGSFLRVLLTKVSVYLVKQHKRQFWNWIRCYQIPTSLFNLLVNRLRVQNIGFSDESLQEMGCVLILERQSKTIITCRVICGAILLCRMAWLVLCLITLSGMFLNSCTLCFVMFYVRCINNVGHVQQSHWN